MKPIQDRIIKDFRKKFPNLRVYMNNGIERFCEGQVEQFLIQSIKEVEEETRKEVKEFILNRDNCSLVKQTATTNNGVVNTYLYDGDLILKSITNKEKQ